LPLPKAEELQIGGFVPLTTVDFPGELAAVVFCQGCPWRCGYCQNAHLLPRTCPDPLPWAQVRAFLERRIGLLDAVVFSGGEPTLQRALPDAISEVKKMGFKVGLHTAGVYPERLGVVVGEGLVDWVGLDIKGPVGRYEAITGVAGSGERAWESLEMLLRERDRGRVRFEVRVTVHPELLSVEQVGEMARGLRELGVEEMVLQECVAGHCLDQGLRGALEVGYLGGYREVLERVGVDVLERGAC